MTGRERITMARRRDIIRARVRQLQKAETLMEEARTALLTEDDLCFEGYDGEAYSNFIETVVIKGLTPERVRFVMRTVGITTT